MPDIDVTVADVAAAHGAGRIADARLLVDRLLARNPKDGDALMWSGLVAISELRLPEAMAAFEQALRVRTDPWSLANLGTCYTKVGRLEDAERSLRRAIEIKPNLLGASIGLAAALHGLRRFDEALVQLDAAAANAADEHKVALRRGCTLVELGRFDEAQAAFELAVERTADFTFPRLARFDRATFETVTAGPPVSMPPDVEYESAGAAGDMSGVVVVSCNPPYARKYGVPFLRSYAEHAKANHLLHVHIPDPDERIVDEIREVASRAGLAAVRITTEDSPFPATELQQRKAFYACARLLHLPYWLDQYHAPILVMDVDFIVESPVTALFESAADHDLALNARHPIDSPWLDIIANLIVARPTPAARRYCSAVARYAMMNLVRERKAWLVDQAALFCVLKMLERYSTPPKVCWLPHAHQSGLWHLGHDYDHLLDDPRFQRYAG